MKKSNFILKLMIPRDYFYVVASRTIGLSVTSDTDDVLIDKCDEGDILGLRPFLLKTII